MNIKVARIQFAKYQRRQKVIAEIVQRICSNRRMLLFIGKFRLASNSPVRGYVRTPLKGLAYALECYPMIDVVYGDEFNTSQRCSKCFEQLTFHGYRKRNVLTPDCHSENNMAPMPRRWKININGKWLQSSGVRQTMMDRDFNAARCIRYKGTCMIAKCSIRRGISTLKHIWAPDYGQSKCCSNDIDSNVSIKLIFYFCLLNACNRNETYFYYAVIR